MIAHVRLLPAVFRSFVSPDMLLFQRCLEGSLHSLLILAFRQCKPTHLSHYHCVKLGGQTRAPGCNTCRCHCLGGSYTPPCRWRTLEGIESPKLTPRYSWSPRASSSPRSLLSSPSLQNRCTPQSKHLHIACRVMRFLIGIEQPPCTSFRSHSSLCSASHGSKPR